MTSRNDPRTRNQRPPPTPTSSQERGPTTQPQPPSTSDRVDHLRALEGLIAAMTRRTPSGGECLIGLASFTVRYESGWWEWDYLGETYWTLEDLAVALLPTRGQLREGMDPPPPHAVTEWARVVADIGDPVLPGGHAQPGGGDRSGDPEPSRTCPDETLGSRHGLESVERGQGASRTTLPSMPPEATLNP